MSVKYDEALEFHRSWTELAQAAQDDGYTTRWAPADAQLVLQNSAERQLLRISGTRLAASSLTEHLALDRAADVLGAVKPSGLSSLHSSAIFLDPLSGSLERARSRVLSGLFAPLVDASKAVDCSFATTLETEVDGFLSATTTLTIVDSEEAAERMPDKGRISGIKWPKVGLLFEVVHHSHVDWTTEDPSTDIVTAAAAALAEASAWSDLAWAAVYKALH